MYKKLLILDLDNTIYPVSTIAKKLFNELFAHIEKSGAFSGDVEEIKLEIQRTPFQKVAEQFQFSQQLLKECLDIHTTLIYPDPMQAFDDYPIVRDLKIEKMLVTSGFRKLQESKVDQLKIRDDFSEIHIIDLQEKQQTKKDVFKHILNNTKLAPQEILVIGDDLNSEIQAANDLGISSVLYDRNKTLSEKSKQATIQSFHEIHKFL